MTDPVTRRILILVHPRRAEAKKLAQDVVERLLSAGIEVVVLADNPVSARIRDLPGVRFADPQAPAQGCELVLILGGDGTILYGAEVSRGSRVPLLGVNFGRVGFLAEAERDGLEETVERIVARDYTVEERMTLQVTATDDDRPVFSSWALNEVTVEKASRERMIELTVAIDGHPLSTWGCDGIVMATPTGSTAYAFSAGGPVVWPWVDALLLVPISAHALFARPVVVGPTSSFDVEIVPHEGGGAVVWCDGRRAVDLPPGAAVHVERSSDPVFLARLDTRPFTDRIVEKFDLAIHGWREPPTLPGG